MALGVVPVRSGDSESNSFANIAEVQDHLKVKPSQSEKSRAGPMNTLIELETKTDGWYW
jgi:hypothetical protein